MAIEEFGINAFNSGMSSQKKRMSVSISMDFHTIIHTIWAWPKPNALIVLMCKLWLTPIHYQPHLDNL